ncbi:MAG: PEP/pyruvate-binding domain-containing protein [Nanoarchaeota archaeon]
MVGKGEVASDFIRWFSESGAQDISLMGSKGAFLSEMYREKYPVPAGFCVTSKAYNHFLEKSGLSTKIMSLFENTDMNDFKKIEEISGQIKKMILDASIPSDLADAVSEAYDILDVDKHVFEGKDSSALAILKRSFEPLFVSVRSSVCSKETESFAGQHDSYLHVKGEKDVLRRVKQCFASLFNACALKYRSLKGMSWNDFSLGVVIQHMIDSERSGTLFTKDPLTSNRMVVEAVWGLGEGVVSGVITPDHYELSEKEGELSIERVNIALKKHAVLRDSSGESSIVKLSEGKSTYQVLSEREVKMLARTALRCEEHFKQPLAIEFAYIGEELFLLEARPLCFTLNEPSNKNYTGNEILKGFANGVPGQGDVKIISDNDFSHVNKNDAVVRSFLYPDALLALSSAGLLIAEEGGSTSHAAVLARELGIACMVGATGAIGRLKEGTTVVLDGSKIYEDMSERVDAKKEEKEEAIIGKVKVNLQEREFLKEAPSNVDALGESLSWENLPVPFEEKDIEEVILEELSADEKETYEPGSHDSKRDIPPLNDAIVVGETLDQSIFSRLEDSLS